MATIKFFVFCRSRTSPFLDEIERQFKTEFDYCQEAENLLYPQCLRSQRPNYDSKPYLFVYEKVSRHVLAARKTLVKHAEDLEYQHRGTPSESLGLR